MADLQVGGSALTDTDRADIRAGLGLGDSATRAVGTTAGTVAAGDDSRLSNARTPTAHASSHAAGEADEITPDSIGAQRDGYVGPVAVTGTPTAGQVPIASSGTAAAWGAATAAPAGSDGQLQINDGGALGTDADLRWDKPTNTLYLVNNFISGSSSGSLLTISGSAGSTVLISPRLAPAWGAGFGYVEPGMTIAATGSMAWTDTGSSPLAGTSDLRLYRVGAGILGQHNGANAQQHQWYGTRTDASNYRRVSLGMSTAGVGYLRPEGAGTGASGNVLHISGLPTSNPGPGILWNDAGTVKVGT